jgi:hypothetical protein
MSDFSVSNLLAAKSLEILEGNIQVGNLFNNDIEANFSKNPRTGDQVRVNRRQTVKPVSRASGQEVTKQSITESTISFNITDELDTTVPIDTQELTLDIDPSEMISTDKLMQFMDTNVSRVVTPVAVGMAEDLESRVLAEVNNVPAIHPIDVSTSLPSTNSEFLEIAKQLDVFKVPVVGRFCLATPDLYYNMAGLLQKVNESGSSAGLREGVVGRLAGFDVYMSQYFPEELHTTGTIGTAELATDALVGSTNISLTNADEATGTFKAGDTVIISGYGNVVVSGDVTASTGAVTISIKEPLRSTIQANTAIANYGVTGGVAISYKTVGYFGVADCIAFASIAPVIQGANVDSASINRDGYGINTNLTYNPDFKATALSMSSLFGVKMLDGRMGVKVVQKVA